MVEKLKNLKLQTGDIVKTKSRELFFIKSCIIQDDRVIGAHAHKLGRQDHKVVFGKNSKLEIVTDKDAILAGASRPTISTSGQSKDKNEKNGPLNGDGPKLIREEQECII